MLKVVTLDKKLTPEEFSFWVQTINSIAIRHFKFVPLKDIETLLCNAQSGQGLVYIIYNNNKPSGFGGVLYRSIMIDQCLYNYILLDIGCMDSTIRGHHILGMIGMQKILHYKFKSMRNLFQKTYVLAICITPQAYLMYQLIENWLNVDSISAASCLIYNEILTSYCKEFDLIYFGCGKPIQFRTWIPFTASKVTHRDDVRIQYFLDNNPRWQEGSGLPLLIPLNWKNMIVLIKKIIFYKIENIFSCSIF
ncbi:MAG: hypothetical protein NTZ67_09310 [Gammaproteobacteria bacterium]|nr:hypothetical protein [Gammaproteobacteria bacterium]